MTVEMLPLPEKTFLANPNTPGVNALLSAALHAFRSIGYHGATIRNIAREVNVTPASVYHHFDSKQEMLVRIMERAMRDNVTAVLEAYRSAPSDDVEAQFRATVGAIVDYHTHHPEEAFVGNSELRSLEPEGFALIAALRNAEEDFFVQLIDAGVEADVFATDNSKAAARAVIALASSVGNWYRPDGSLSVDAIREQYVDFALNMIQPRR